MGYVVIGSGPRVAEPVRYEVATASLALKRRAAMQSFLGDGAEVAVERDGRRVSADELAWLARAEAERPNHA